MRLYSWRTGEGCGEVFVAPRWLAWAPDGQAAALAYADALVLCRTQPAFSAFASLPLRVRPDCWRHACCRVQFAAGPPLCTADDTPNVQLPLHLITCGFLV